MCNAKERRGRLLYVGINNGCHTKHEMLESWISG